MILNMSNQIFKIMFIISTTKSIQLYTIVNMSTHFIGNLKLKTMYFNK